MILNEKKHTSIKFDKTEIIFNPNYPRHLRSIKLKIIFNHNNQRHLRSIKQKMNKQEEEKSPILKSWRNVYALVIGILIVVIISLYFFTQHYK